MHRGRCRRPYPIRGRAARIRRAGVKLTEQGSVELRVRTADGDRIRFWVRDTGIGMGDETLHRVILPFEQGESTAELQKLLVRYAAESSATWAG